MGRSFADIESLDAFVADRRQVLLNNRALASVVGSYDLSPTTSGSSDVALHFAVVDTWNLVALPYPKYDSNTGLTLYVKGRDYNFAGSMQTMNLDLGFISDTYENKSLVAATTLALPFIAFGSEWTLGFSQDLQLWTKDSTTRSATSVSLALNITGLGFPAAVTATQGFYYNANQPAAEPDPFFLSESLSFGATIPMGINLGSLGGLFYNPSVSVSQNWWPGVELSYAGRPGVVAGFGNSISTGRVDWDGNMRRGISLAASSIQAFNALSNSLSWNLGASVNGFGSWFGGRLGLAANAIAVDQTMGIPIIAGGYLRGVIDARLYGVAMLASSVEIPVKLFDFPSHILFKKRWFDFELQAQPFIDAAIVVPNWSAKVSSNWLWTSGGLEFLVFPEVMRSFIVRASIGWDLRSVLANHSLTALTSDGFSPYEIYFGTGLAY